MYKQTRQSNNQFQASHQPWDEDLTVADKGNESEFSSAGDPEIDLGEMLLNDYPDGIPVIVYLDNDKAEFKPASLLWAQQHKAVGILDKTIAVDQIKVGHAIPHQMEEGTGNNARTIRMDEVIPNFAAILKSSVDKAEIARSLNDPAYVKNVEAPKIKTLALASHGSCYGWGGNMDTNDVPTFIPAISPYLTNDVNVIMYACGTGTNPGEDYSWYNKTEGGELSVAAQVRDQLAATNHTEARVWGHLVSGHFLDVWPQRYFDASAPGQPGVNYFTYVFGSAIATYAVEVVGELRKLDYLLWDTLQVDDASQRAKESVQDNYYAAYQHAMNTLSYGNSVKGTSELGEMAPVDPDGVAQIIRDHYEASYKAKTPAASETAPKISTKVVPKLQNIPGLGKADAKMMTATMKENILALQPQEKDKIPDAVTQFMNLQEVNYPSEVNPEFKALLTTYQEAMNTAKGLVLVQPGTINEAVIKDMDGTK